MTQQKQHLAAYLGTFVVLVSGLVTGWMALDRRVTANEVALSSIKEQVAREDARRYQDFRDIKEQLTRIEDHVFRLGPKK